MKLGELDGADEKMLSEEEKNYNTEIIVTDFKNEKQNGDTKLNIGEYFRFHFI